MVSSASAARGLTEAYLAYGLGIGALVVPPVATVFIATFGWRETCLVFGIFVLARWREHDPEKWEPIFGKDPAQTKDHSAQLNRITV